jgi:hypothetical protein
MSVAAQKWAWEQNLPDRPKFVLVTLADQADSRTGHVCYQRTDTAFFVDKIGIPERSFYRCVAALARHGYLLRESGRGRGREPQYWLCLNREPTEISSWTWTVDDSPANAGNNEEIQDVDETATMADQINSAEVCHGEHVGLPLVAEQDSLVVPKIPRAPAQAAKSGFSSQAQAVDRASTKGGESENRVFVIEGTKAWAAWIAYRRATGQRPINFTYRGENEHSRHTGRHFPTLFPPKLDTQA